MTAAPNFSVTFAWKSPITSSEISFFEPPVIVKVSPNLIWFFSANTSLIIALCVSFSAICLPAIKVSFSDVKNSCSEERQTPTPVTQWLNSSSTGTVPGIGRSPSYRFSVEASQYFTPVIFRIFATISGDTCFIEYMRTSFVPSSFSDSSWR